MRALVIAPQPFFTPRGTPFSVYYRTLVMSELGITTDLLTYGEGQDVDIRGVRIIRGPRFSWLGNVKTGPSIQKLFLDVFVFVRTIGLLLTNRYDFIHAHEEAVFFSRFLKSFFRFKLVYDMHSSLPQQLSNFKYTESRLIYRLFKWLEDSSINTADAVITICPDLADYVNTIIMNPNKHHLIENSIFEPVLLKSAQEPEVSEAPSDFVNLSKNRINIVYAGTLEHYQGIDLLLKSFKLVLENCPEAFLTIVGGTQAQVDKYLQIAGSEGVKESCCFTGRVPQQEAVGYTSLATVQVSPRTEGTNTPLKVYQQLASGIPLVATSIYSHTQVLDSNVAFLAAPNAKAFSKAMIEAISNRELAKQIADNALILYKEKYSRKQYVAKMSNMLESLK